MTNPIIITVNNFDHPKQIIINEDMICSIIRGNSNIAIIKMVNQDEWICTNPPYDQWENDFLKK